MTRKGNERRRRRFAEADDHAAIVDEGRAVPWGLSTLGVTATTATTATTKARHAARMVAARRDKRAWAAASDEERRFRAAYHGEGRFKLAECEGYLGIGLASRGVTVAVLDRAANHRIVAQFRTEDARKGAAWTREHARRYAAELEWKYAR